MSPEPTQHAESVAAEEPLLGLATTRQMLEELAVRFEVPTPRLGAHKHMILLLQTLPTHVLDYRTVDGDL